MTDSPSSDRDELVAAYLDGEATPAERAIVEGDAELMERVAILSQVVSLVSEPVAPPPPEVRRAHIAAALDVSATAPNVTSMADKRRRRVSPSQLAAAAAAAVAVIAIPIALSQTGGDDDDTAVASFESAASSDDGASTTDVGDASGEAFSAAEPAEEPALESAALDADEDAAGDDGAEEAAEEGLAEQEPVEETASDSEGDDAGSDLAVLPRVDVELATDVDNLVSQILPPPEGARLTPPVFASADELVCVDPIAETGAGDPVVVTGATVLDNEFVEYVVVERIIDGRPTLELTIFDLSCNPTTATTLDG